MRNVLSNTNEVCHYWANKVQASGRCGNVSFEGDKIYSYRACIGRHLPNGMVAISNHRYSNTTSGHQSDVWSASRHLSVISVTYPGDVRDSCTAMQREIESLLRQASVAKSKRDYYLASAHTVAKNFNAFAEALESDLRITPPVSDPATLEVIRNTVKAEAKRQAEARKERERQANLSAQEALAEWRTGGAAHLTIRDATVALRIHGEQIQTSRGAAIPLAAAPTLWKLIQRVMKGDRDYEVGQAVGVYQLTKIRRDGSIVVGCHDIPHSEIRGIALQLYLIQELEAA